jgi:hypothetical protein
MEKQILIVCLVILVLVYVIFNKLEKIYIITNKGFEMVTDNQCILERKINYINSKNTEKKPIVKKDPNEKTGSKSSKKK